MMTPIEMISFFSHESDRVLAAARETGNPYLAAANVNTGFTHRFAAGLISWRLKRDDTPNQLNRAICIAEEASDIVPNADLLSPSLFAAAGYAQFLLRNVVCESFMARLPANEFKPSSTHLLASLDRCVLKALSFGVAASVECTDGASQPSQQKRTKLVAATYDCYLDLLRREKGEESAVRLAETLFRNRARDSYFSGATSIEGGGHDNEVMVDYRLAAILYAISSDVPSEHRWLW